MKKQLLFMTFLATLATCGSKTVTREATPEEKELYKKIKNKKWALVFETGKGDISKNENYDDFIFYDDSTYLYRIIYSAGDTGEFGRANDVIEEDENGKIIKPNTWYISGDTLFTKVGDWVIQKLTADSLELEHLKRKKLYGHRCIYVSKR